MTGGVKRNWKGLKAHGRSALRQHLLSVAERARVQHGPSFDAAGFASLFNDRDVVRFPTRLAFGDAGVRPGTLAAVRWTELGVTPREATIQVLARFAQHPELALAVAYYLPCVNYGRMPTADDCLAFGATLLGMDEDTYHARLCVLMDESHG